MYLQKCWAIPALSVFHRYNDCFFVKLDPITIRNWFLFPDCWLVLHLMYKADQSDFICLVYLYDNNDEINYSKCWITVTAMIGSTGTMIILYTLQQYAQKYVIII